MKTIKSCTCGNPRPYKRANKCKPCWNATSAEVKDLLAKGRVSLRLVNQKLPKQGNLVSRNRDSD